MIDERTRMEAIVLCQYAALDPEEYGPVQYDQVRIDGVRFSEGAINLAYNVWFAVHAAVNTEDWSRVQVEAECAALLANGWCLGDEIRLL